MIFTDKIILIKSHSVIIKYNTNLHVHITDSTLFSCLNTKYLKKIFIDSLNLEISVCIYFTKEETFFYEDIQKILYTNYVSNSYNESNHVKN